MDRRLEKKGFEYLVRAAPLLPEVDIRLYGYGPLEDDLRRVAAEVGATNVEFAGIIEGPEALEDTYRQADLFVLPCVRAADGDLDGLPTVLLEAMGAGVPAVGCVGEPGPQDIAEAGAGLSLVAPGDIEDLAHAIGALAREVMQGAAQLKVPLIVDVGSGRSWAEAH